MRNPAIRPRPPTRSDVRSHRPGPSAPTLAARPLLYDAVLGAGLAAQVLGLLCFAFALGETLARGTTAPVDAVGYVFGVLSCGSGAAVVAERGMR